MKLAELTDANRGTTIVHRRFSGTLMDWIQPLGPSYFGVVAVISEGKLRKFAVQKNERFSLS